jgi:mannose-6-phosphate isomerase class I
VVPLNDLLSEAAPVVLGASAARRFNSQLPFLLKVLSAANLLSIQVHPTKERAKEGYARENARGIPIDARERSYKDENHKPELIAALTDFHGLLDFRPLMEIAQTLEDVPELGSLSAGLVSSSSVESLFRRLMNTSQEDVDSILDPLVRRLRKENDEETFSRDQREYWVLRADREFSKDRHKDRGLISIYLLNLVHLQPGEAMYLPPGALHGYLEGSGMEIMANSNNVLRGGLTSKHVDVPELLKNTNFDPVPPEILRGKRVHGYREWVYGTSAEEFELRRVEWTDGYEVGADHGVEILFLIESRRQATIVSEGHSLELRRGEACLVPHGLSYTIRADTEAVFYKAAVPLDS